MRKDVGDSNLSRANVFGKGILEETREKETSPISLQSQVLIILSLYSSIFLVFVEVGHSESRQGRLWDNTGARQRLEHCLT